MKDKKPEVKSPAAMLVMTAIVIALVGYLFWDTIQAYLAGGEQAPSLTTVVVGGLILLGGCVVVVTSAIRIFLQEKRKKKEEE